ncbi:MAG: TRAP transporter substrate-binding protein DctP [Treponema sp.]|jgi:TRAP-type C4-dicarboxylate transport system substrate-binding protein|nr:TRAP transporter substrate-binding protein DctP [Treponema sp.]
MKKTVWCVLGCMLFFSVLLPGPVFAQRRKLTIKLASLVPENTPWGDALNRMAGEWAQISNGEVELIIYHNGVAGTEVDALRKLRLNQAQAAMLSSFSLDTIAPGIMTLSCPFLIRNNAELDIVLETLKPELERRISEKNFFPLAWSKVGWVRFFSKSPVFVPADLKSLKLGTDENDPAMIDAFKAMGYKMVPVAMNQVLISLGSGMIEAMYQSPVNMAGTQAFGVAKHMASIAIAPFMGCIVLNQTTWNRIPEQYRDALRQSARRMEAELSVSIQELEQSVIKSMQKNGLIIHEINDAQQQLWYDDVGRVIPSLLGSTFDRGMYQRIETIVKNQRGK